MKHDLFTTAIVLAERGLFVLVNFGLFALLTRYLGPTDFGRLIVLLAIVRIFETVSQFGVDALFQKLIRREPTLCNYRAAFRVRQYSSWLAAAGIYAFAWLTLEDVDRSVLGWFAVVFLFKAWDINESLLLVKFKHLWVASGRLLATTVMATTQIIAIVLDAGYEAIALTYAMEALLLPIIFRAMAFRLDLIKALDCTAVDHNLKVGALVPMALTAIVATLFWRQDLLVINHFVSSAHVAVYAIGVRIQNVFLILPQSVISVFYPRLLAIENDPGQFRHTVVKVGVILFYPAVLFSLAVSLFSEEALLLLGGQQFVAFSYHLGLYIWALPLFSLSFVQARLHLLRDDEVQNLLTAGVSLVFSLCCYLLLVEPLGLQGIALGYLLTRILTTFILPLVVPKQRFFLSYVAEIVLPFRLIRALVSGVARRIK